MTIQSFFDRDRFLARVDEILPDPSAVLTEDQRSTLETFRTLWREPEDD